jgi:hypothetical protein
MDIMIVRMIHAIAAAIGKAIIVPIVFRPARSPAATGPEIASLPGKGEAAILFVMPGVELHFDCGRHDTAPGPKIEAESGQFPCHPALHANSPQSFRIPLPYQKEQIKNIHPICAMSLNPRTATLSSVTGRDTGGLKLGG